MRLARSSLTLILLALLALPGCRSTGEFGSEHERLIDQSRITFQSMMGDNQFPTLVDLASRAKAIIIIPNQVRIAFFLGGRGGNAIMTVRNEQGQWSPPAFYTIGGIGFGLQFGGQTQEFIITVMSDRGVTAIMDRNVTLGGDAGLAIGELGRGVNAATGIGLSSDLYAFARSEGLFAGVSLEGTVIAPRPAWNHEMYGTDATPQSILIDRSVDATSKSVADLIAAMP